jgi:hypothetical protein
MAACERGEVYLHAFLILEVDAGSDQLLASSIFFLVGGGGEGGASTLTSSVMTNE